MKTTETKEEVMICYTDTESTVATSYHLLFRWKRIKLCIYWFEVDVNEPIGIQFW